jgi:hypothetical protein
MNSLAGSRLAPTRRQFLKRALGSVALVGVHAGSGVPCAWGADAGSASPQDDGYRGIWFTLGQKSEFGDKYSGGLGTYTANHVPMAIHAPEVGRTFFVYGGARAGRRHLLAMASYYDHRNNLVPRPTIVHDKQGVDDPHDNPSLCLDGEGHLWVFVSGRARARPGLMYRSRKPFSVETFEKVGEREFTYPQPRWIPGRGLVLLFTKYTRGRELYLSSSRDGRSWSTDEKMAGIGGHYQTSHLAGGKILTAFNRHPGGAVDRRTDLYFMQSEDGGDTWVSAAGKSVELPLSAPENPARVHDFESARRLIYIHDLDLDSNGRPVILFVSSADHRPGPPGDPRRWSVARWNGGRWIFTTVTRANHNYSTGSLVLGPGDRWEIVGPTEPGPQPLGSGGEVAAWESLDAGETWSKRRDLTKGSPRNHNYVRRPLNAHPDFAAFWADGDPDAESRSCLYFSNRAGDAVWRLPYDMTQELESPERVGVA